VPFVSHYLCHSLMLMMIMMTFDVKLISQNCTHEAIAKKIAVGSPRVVMLSISISVHSMLNSRHQTDEAGDSGW